MAKEKFERTKPHVNVGTIGHNTTLEDTAGQLVVSEAGPENEGNPAPSSVLAFSAPPSSVSEKASVAFPIDTDFVYDPATSGPVEFLDFQLDVLPARVEGTDEVEISLAIVQGESFVASSARGVPIVTGAETEWTHLGMSGLGVEDFFAVDGDEDKPDFDRPFQFGYAFSSEYSSTALNVELGLDNMQVEITTIPEPTSIVMAITLGAALWWQRWRNNDDED